MYPTWDIFPRALSLEINVQALSLRKSSKTPLVRVSRSKDGSSLSLELILYPFPLLFLLCYRLCMDVMIMNIKKSFYINFYLLFL